MRGVLAGVLVTVAIAGCGDERGPTEPEGPFRGATFARPTVNGQAVVLARPRKATGRVVVYAHGAGETAEGAFNNEENAPIFSALLGDGYAVVASEAHGNSWGNRESERDYAALIPALRRRGLSKVYVLARSMGGLNGLQLLSRARVRAWAGIFPVCSLRSIYRDGRFRDSIRQAHGPGLGAALRLGPRRAAFRPGLPVRLWASPADTFVPKRSNADACAAAARARGARVTVTTTRGEHGDASNFDARGLLAHFNSA